jgi:hypothetical protein
MLIFPAIKNIDKSKRHVKIVSKCLTRFTRAWFNLKPTGAQIGADYSINGLFKKKLPAGKCKTVNIRGSLS